MFQTAATALRQLESSMMEVY